MTVASVITVELWHMVITTDMDTVLDERDRYLM